MDNNAEKLYHARAALRYIARTCDDPDTAQFAREAAEGQARAEDQDYEHVTGIEAPGDGTVAVNEQHYSAMMSSLMALVSEKGGHAYIARSALRGLESFGLYLKGAGDREGWVIELAPEEHVSKA